MPASVRSRSEPAAVDSTLAMSSDELARKIIGRAFISLESKDAAIEGGAPTTPPADEAARAVLARYELLETLGSARSGRSSARATAAWTGSSR